MDTKYSLLKYFSLQPSFYPEHPSEIDFIRPVLRWDSIRERALARVLVRALVPKRIASLLNVVATNRFSLFRATSIITDSFERLYVCEVRANMW